MGICTFLWIAVGICNDNGSVRRRTDMDTVLVHEDRVVVRFKAFGEGDVGVLVNVRIYLERICAVLVKELDLVRYLGCLRKALVGPLHLHACTCSEYFLCWSGNCHGPSPERTLGEGQYR